MTPLDRIGPDRARRVHLRVLTALSAMTAAVVVSGWANAGQTDRVNPREGSWRPDLHALVLGDDAVAVAAESRIRIVNGSSTVPAVDIYVTAPGALIADPAIKPAFSAVPFGVSTDLFALTPGTYDVTVTVAGETDGAMVLPGLGFGAGDMLTVIARDRGAAEGRPGPALVVIDTNPATTGGVL